MGKRRGVTTEFFMFVRERKAYWLTPIIAVLLILIGLIILGAAGGGAAAPFIYSLF